MDIANYKKIYRDVFNLFEKYLQAEGEYIAKHYADEYVAVLEKHNNSPFCKGLLDLNEEELKKRFERK